MRRSIPPLISIAVLLMTACNLLPWAERPTEESGQMELPAAATTVPLDATYINEKLGIEFKYPAAWGPIVEGIEKCTYDVDGANEKNPCEHVALSFMGVTERPHFLASYSLLAADNPFERHGYWGDRVGLIRDESFVRNFCEDDTSTSWPQLSSFECKTYTNQDGVLITRSREDIGWGNKALMYYIKSPHPIFFGLTLSTYDLVPNPTSLTGAVGIEEAEGVMDALVDSLQFLPSS